MKVAGHPRPFRIASRSALTRVWENSKDARGRGSAPGVDGVTPRKFGADIDHHVVRLRDELVSGEFRFAKLRPFEIPKPGGKVRIICAPTVRDRLVQRLVCEYLLERDKLGVKNTVSYGFIRGAGGVPAAIKRACNLRPNYPWALKSDISSFFDTIDRQLLVSELANKIGSSSLFPVVRQAIECEVADDRRSVRQILRNAGIQVGKGLRQGMPLSPLLSNFVLKKFDRHFTVRHAKLVRYADDFVIFASSEEECRDLLADAKSILAEKGHTVPDPGLDSKTMIARPQDPIEFLGYELVPRAGSQNYSIQVPKRAFEKVAAAFAQYARLDVALKEFKTLDRLMRRNNSVAQSYANVYFLGRNREDLRSHIETCRSNAISQIAIDLFGVDVLSSLSEEKRSFLGLQVTGLDDDY